MQRYAVEVAGLHKVYGRKTVLKSIDLRVPEGSVFALLGPNGAGKTTLIHILSTLLEPDGGEARVAGYDVVRQKERVKRSISLTGQYAALDEVLTGAENLHMIGRLSGLTTKAARTRTDELLERFGLTAAARQQVKVYSGGMRRRLDLAASLVVPRPIVFLDEPTTGLDLSSRRTLWDLIVGLKDDGVTVFLTTQYLEEADQLADTVAVLNEGEVVAAGEASALKAKVGGDVLVLMDAGGDVIEEIPTDGTILEVAQIVANLSGRVPADTRLGMRRPTMDDVFLALTTATLQPLPTASATARRSAPQPVQRSARQEVL